MRRYGELFAVNLKKLRKERGMTQRALAEVCGYSEKAVSKWEHGESVPSIDILFILARVFSISVDELFADEKTVYYLGVDGGGTKTELALADASGKIIRTCMAPCSNPMDIGAEAAKSVLREAIYDVCRDIPLSSVCMFAGIAGGASADMKRTMTAFFGEFRFRAFENDGDNQNIIEAGLGREDGITVILGTGICVFSQIRGKQEKVAGWGYLIDDGGSAYNIGRDALHAYFGALDGSEEASLLSERISALGEDPQRLLRRIYAEGKRTVASFAPLVYRAAEDGDETAEAIINRNMAEAAHAIETAAKRFKRYPIKVVAAGGLLKEPRVTGDLRAALRHPERFEITALDCAPVIGAVRRAMALDGAAVPDDIRREGEKTAEAEEQAIERD